MTESPSLTLASTIQRGEGLLAADLDDQVVVMAVALGKYISLDAVGSDIWHRLEKPILISDLCTALSRDYTADTDTIREDVLPFIAWLAAEGLVEVRA